MTASAAALRSRIHGIDVARALAIIGMVMAHTAPFGSSDDGGVFGAIYRSVNGRAAILFGVLAGVGVSILHDRSRGSIVGTMLWRAVVLFPIGLWLQTLETPVAVILQYYAFFFLVGSFATQLADRVLFTTAVGIAFIGPLTILGMRGAGLSRPPIPDWYELDETLFLILIAGYYPLVTWVAPLFMGMWLGRRDLRSEAFSRRLVLGGAMALALGYLISIVLSDRLGTPANPADLRNLVAIEPHNQMPLWLITATGVASMVLGMALIVERRFPTWMAGLAAVGRLAFTVYVTHLVILGANSELLAGNDTYAEAWASIIRFVLVALILCYAYVQLVGTGPFEWLLRAPQSIARRRRLKASIPAS